MSNAGWLNNACRSAAVWDGVGLTQEKASAAKLPTPLVRNPICVSNPSASYVVTSTADDARVIVPPAASRGTPLASAVLPCIETRSAMTVLAVRLIVPPSPARNRFSRKLSLAPPLSGPARKATLLTTLTVPVAIVLPPVASTPPDPSNTELTTLPVPPASTNTGPLSAPTTVVFETLIWESLPAISPPAVASRPYALLMTT